MVVALAVLVGLAFLVWRTMDPGKYQQLTWLLIGFFALRVVLGKLRSRKMENAEPVQDKDRLGVQ